MLLAIMIILAAGKKFRFLHCPNLYIYKFVDHTDQLIMVNGVEVEKKKNFKA